VSWGGELLFDEQRVTFVLPVAQIHTAASPVPPSPIGFDLDELDIARAIAATVRSSHGGEDPLPNYLGLAHV
jgi:hypothetical protein